RAARTRAEGMPQGSAQGERGGRQRRDRDGGEGAEGSVEGAEERQMPRIRTTHVGSLPRPHALLDQMKARLAGQPYDREHYDGRVRRAVAECVRRQIDCGIDIVADGEQSKPGFFTYVKERLAGFEPRPGKKVAFFDAERQAFPEYYKEYFARAMTGGSIAPGVPMVCPGPVTYVGEEALRRDIANLKAALAATGARVAFMPS